MDSDQEEAKIFAETENKDGVDYPAAVFQRIERRIVSGVSFVLQAEGDFVTIVTERDVVDLTYAQFQQLVGIVCGLHDGTTKEGVADAS